jgi:DNA-binding CsgD family transcriptional regulator
VKRVPSGTVTFLLTDVEASTQAWESDRSAAAAAVARQEEILADAIAVHGGFRPVEQGEGDSVVAAFTRASDAVVAAVDAQLALAREPWTTGEPLRVRMALHTGEADLELARSSLDPEAFEAAWAEGAALGVDEAVAYASRGRGERKRPSTGWASLTPMERQVVDLVAEGLRNAEIAERLFVAPSTIKTHLGHIFAKLGVATRAELAALAARRP